MVRGPRARDDLTVVELDGEAVIYDDETGALHHLNQSATTVFSLCDGTALIKELAADIAAALGRPVDDVDRQVRSVIRDLRRVGLLEPPARRSRPRAAATAETPDATPEIDDLELGTPEPST